MESKQCIQYASDYVKQLENMYSNYLKMLTDLEQSVIEYDVLDSHIKLIF